MKGVKLVSFFITVCLLLLLLTACGGLGNDTALTVNGIPISLEEYDMVSGALRSDVLLYYTEKFGETDFSNSFWSRSYGKSESTPAEKLRELTIKKLTENHIILSLAKKEMLISDDTYSGILKDMERENADRADKLQGNAPIYGVAQFTAKEYYEYVLSNCSVSLRNNIANDLTDAQLEAFYEEKKGELYKVPPVLLCKQIFIGGDVSDSREKGNNVLKLIKEGADVDAAAKAFKLTSSEESYDLSLIRTLSVRLPAVSAAISEMEPGEVRLIEEFSDFYIIKVIKKSKDEYIDYREVITDVKTALALERLNENVSAKANKAKIIVNESALKEK